MAKLRAVQLGVGVLFAGTAAVGASPTGTSFPTACSAADYWGAPFDTAAIAPANDNALHDSA
jgi:hypothetical protein